MVMIEPTSGDGIVRDGFSGTAVPLPRDPGEVNLTMPDPGWEADVVNLASAGGNAANTAGGILYLGADSRTAAIATTGKFSGVLGLNGAAGPAEEQDIVEDDDRSLTTDISPSD